MVNDATDKNEEKNQGFESLLEMLPDEAKDFEGSDFAQPAAMAYFGAPVDIGRLRKKANELRNAKPSAMCEIAMVMAEVIESNSADKGKFFINDADTRGYVFGGSKWKAGWVCILGSDDHAELIEKFKEKDFLVFAQKNAAKDAAIDLGPRGTASVYFLHLMVRYAMTWGRIAPGDDHEMGHYLEVDMPGVVIGHGDLTPVEELLLLALMKMGAPAVVPPDYPFDLGRQVRASGADDIIDAAVKFPNLRVKEIGGETISLPDYCDPANSREEMPEDAKKIGGENSFLVLMPSKVEQGIEIPPEDNLAEVNEIGIMVEIGDERLDICASEYLEVTALNSINMIKGVRAVQTDSNEFFIAFADGAKVLASQIAGAISAGLRHAFPHLGKIHVRIVTDEGEILKSREQIDLFKSKRAKAIEDETDETVSRYFYCIECQPFAQEHVCIITPDRPPMCGRDPFQVRTAVLFGATWHPYKRREIENEELRGIIPIEEPINAETGEYESVNRMVKSLSDGKMERLELYSVRNYPHSSCGCFQFVAFWMESESGIGVMERSYEGIAPGEITWNYLANQAGGKQNPGFTGISGEYLRSKKFLRGDGGCAAVKWVSPKAYEIMKDLLSDPSKVAVGE